MQEAAEVISHWLVCWSSHRATHCRMSRHIKQMHVCVDVACATDHAGGVHIILHIYIYMQCVCVRV